MTAPFQERGLTLFNSKLAKKEMDRYRSIFMVAERHIYFNHASGASLSRATPNAMVRILDAVMVVCEHNRDSAAGLFRHVKPKNTVTSARLGRSQVSSHFYDTPAHLDSLIADFPS
jgi:hypothetical protein